MRYVALGDSYTIGTSVDEAERWPNQLVARIPDLELVGNLAVNGYTSADLISHELPALGALRPDLISVLIGVNDVVRGVDPARYAHNVELILDSLVERVTATRVISVATPDYTRTPSGADYGDPDLQSSSIAAANGIMRDACDRRGVAHVAEIFEISLAAGGDRGLVATDGLHPSGIQYRLWVDAIAPVVRQMLARPPG